MGQGGFDGFDDLIQTNAGIYGRDTPSLSHALDDHDRRELTPTSEGLTFALSHDACGSYQVWTVEWPDILALSFGLPPKVGYGTRINPQEASLAERYPRWAQELGDWKLRDHQGPWVLRGLRCHHTSCPKRDLVLTIAPSEAIEAVRVARAQRWVKDEVPLVKWLQQVAAGQQRSQPRRMP